MAAVKLLCGLALACFCFSQVSGQGGSSFRCASAGATCFSLIDYVSPNATTLRSIRTLFSVRNLRSILGANNLPLSTRSDYPIAAGDTVRIRFPCRCSGGYGVSDRTPIYTVVPDDGLYHIAAEVFAGLVTFPQIQAANNISNPNLIDVGQRLWIPLPCSCDEVQGQRVVHYGHVVRAGNTLDGIAQQFNTSQSTLLSLNNMTSAQSLMAGAVLDVPLRACDSSVRPGSDDYPLLVSNGTYVFTARNCVMCRCDPATSWTLQCMSSGIGTCPASQCEGNLALGNTTVSGCNASTCAYAGFNGTIQTTLDVQSTCRSSAVRLLSSNMVFLHLLLLLLPASLFLRL